MEKKKVKKKKKKKDAIKKVVENSDIQQDLTKAEDQIGGQTMEDGRL